MENNKESQYNNLNPDEKNQEQQEKRSVLGWGLIFGTSLGASVGVSIDNLPLGIGVGVGLGLAVGVAVDSLARKKK